MVEINNSESLYKFDIIKFARGIISEVDAIRSFKKVAGEETKKGYIIPIESRVNAFFRLVGLPMFVNFSLTSDDLSEPKDMKSGNRHLSPGYNRDQRSALGYFSIKNTEKVDGADINTIDGVDTTMAEAISNRETILLTRENEVGTEKTNKAMEQAFIAPMPLGANVPNKKGSGGGERNIYKKLKPLVTSYIEVRPRDREMAKPFLFNPDWAKVSENIILSRPFIETVARIRLVSAASAASAQANQNKSDLIKQIEGRIVIEPEDKKNILQHSNVLEQFIIWKMESAINQLAKKWVAIKNSQQNFSKKMGLKILIKSPSSKYNVFGKRAAPIVDFSTLDKTDLGRQLNKFKLLVAGEEALMSLMPTTDTVGLKPTNDSNKNVVKSSLINPFMDILSSDLAKNRIGLASLKNKVQKKIQQAETLRVEMEMMTGEFTGLSVLDVIAVIVGLFLISKDDLLALLDQDTKENMAKDPTLSSAIPPHGKNSTDSVAAAVSAIKALTRSVDSIFDLFNKQIKAIEARSERTTRGTPSGRKKVKNKKRTVTKSERQK